MYRNGGLGGGFWTYNAAPGGCRKGGSRSSKKGDGSSSRRTERTSGLARLGLIDDREDRAQVGH